MDLLYGQSITLIKLVTGCGASTAKRWKANPASIPEPARRLLALTLHGDLGALDARWRGWRIANGQLLSPDGNTFRPGEVQAIPFKEVLLKDYQRRQRLPSQGDWVDGQWQEVRSDRAPAA
jgi:hypothetical protein